MKEKLRFLGLDVHAETIAVAIAVAVYKPHRRGARTKADQYLKDGRVHCVVSAHLHRWRRDRSRHQGQIDAVAAKGTLTGLLTEGGA